jgi:glutamine synthetase
VTKVNIEAEMAATIARTMILPAALRHLELIDDSGVEALDEEMRPIVNDLVSTIQALEAVNADHPDSLTAEAAYMRDQVLPAMDACREHADRLERMIADDLWPLPRYSEMLFIR